MAARDAGSTGTDGGGFKKDAGGSQDMPEQEDEGVSCSCHVGPGAFRAHTSEGSACC